MRILITGSFSEHFYEPVCEHLLYLFRSATLCSIPTFHRRFQFCLGPHHFNGLIRHQAEATFLVYNYLERYTTLYLIIK